MPTPMIKPALARPRLAACRTCGVRVLSGSRVAGDCPKCAGLVPLDLRGADGRFWSVPTTGRTRGGGVS
jgi:hypothetical protein